MRGSVAQLYATGAGQTTPPGITGDVPSHANIADYPVPELPVEVTVGGVSADIVYAGVAPLHNTGLFVVNFRVPSNAPIGDAIPLVLSVGASRSSEGVTMAVRSSVQNVLVVDSNPATRNWVTKVLEIAGFGVFTARDSKEAMAEAKDHPVDVLISDASMPAASEMIRAIRSQHGQLRIIAIAGTSNPDTIKSADAFGAQVFLTKPLNAETVLQHIRELLEARSAP
jgi:CheY-like chemotaxis protein